MVVHGAILVNSCAATCLHLSLSTNLTAVCKSTLTHIHINKCMLCGKNICFVLCLSLWVTVWHKASSKSYPATLATQRCCCIVVPSFPLPFLTFFQLNCSLLIFPLYISSVSAYWFVLCFPQFCSDFFNRYSSGNLLSRERSRQHAGKLMLRPPQPLCLYKRYAEIEQCSHRGLMQIKQRIYAVNSTLNVWKKESTEMQT